MDRTVDLYRSSTPVPEYIVLPKPVFEAAKKHGLIGYVDGFAVWQGFKVVVDGKQPVELSDVHPK